MKNVQHIETIGEYNSLIGQTTLHPLVSIIDFSSLILLKEHKPKQHNVQALSFGFYAIFFKEDKNCEIRYGRNNYDYQEGTLIFIAPRQLTSIEEDGEDYKPSGYALLFHPDFVRGTSLGHNLKDYSFFSYSVYEALHLSEFEKQTVLECFGKIKHELQHGLDKHSKKLIIANIELFLNYSVRFYDRQFITRDHASAGIAEKFENMLNDYFGSGKAQSDGIPTVTFFSKQLHLSTNYFGDLIKKETGKSAQEHIQLKLLDTAKEKMADQAMQVSEIAYSLGFKYPQHFTRFFKQQVGQTPNEYRRSLN